MKFTLLGVLLALPVLAQGDGVKRRADDDKRIETSSAVLSEIMHAKDRGIPQDLMEKAHCVGIVPVLSALDSLSALNTERALSRVGFMIRIAGALRR